MQHPLLIRAFLIVVPLALFYPSLSHDFVNWDDDRFIYESHSLNPPAVDKTIGFWGQSNRGLYMPLTRTAWSVLAGLSAYFPSDAYSLNPALFHATSLLVHLLCVLTVFSILQRVLASAADNRTTQPYANPDSSRISLPAAAGALIFAVHPLQVETVAWASELKDLLCGLFSFLAIGGYLSFALASKGTVSSPKATWNYSLAFVAFLLALFSKPTAVVVPVLAFVLDRWVVKRTLGQTARSLGGWFVVAAVFAVAARFAQHGGAMIVTSPIWGRPFVAGDALAFYSFKLFLPLRLGIDYGRMPAYVLNHWWGYATWLVPAAVAYLVSIATTRTRWAVCLALFVVPLLPVLGLVPFMFQSYSTVADHYVYMPMLGVALATAWLLSEYRSRTVWTIFGIVTALFVMRSVQQVPVWQNEMELYRHALTVNSRSFLAHNNMGLSEAENGRIGAAEYRFAEALKIWSDYPDANTNLGVILAERGKQGEAMRLFERSLAYWPDHPNANRNIGVALAQSGRPHEAIEHYELALRSEPFDELTHSNLGAAYAQQGDFDRAIEHFSEALRIDPEFEQARGFLEMAKRQRPGR